MQINLNWGIYTGVDIALRLTPFSNFVRGKLKTLRLNELRKTPEDISDKARLGLAPFISMKKSKRQRVMK